jgi:hypothetical protein
MPSSSPLATFMASLSQAHAPLEFVSDNATGHAPVQTKQRTASPIKSSPCRWAAVGSPTKPSPPLKSSTVLCLSARRVLGKRQNQRKEISRYSYKSLALHKDTNRPHQLHTQYIVYRVYYYCTYPIVNTTHRHRCITCK